MRALRRIEAYEKSKISHAGATPRPMVVGFFLPFLKPTEGGNYCRIPCARLFCEDFPVSGSEEMAQRRGLHEVLKIELVGPIFAS